MLERTEMYFQMRLRTSSGEFYFWPQEVLEAHKA